MDNKKLIYIEWVDASSDDGWQKQSLLGLHECKSCGFLIAENDKEITLALTVSEDEMNAVMAIPKKWITKRKRIKL